MPTKFALAKVEAKMSDGTDYVFYFDGNGKITRENGSFNDPTPNAFSLVQVEDCPFATTICKSVCYVHNLEKAEAEVHAAYRHNSVELRRVFKNEAYFWKTIDFFSDWICVNCPKGFRWHVSGDIFSLQHACFIREVCNASTVPFWIYTRSFPYLKPLIEPQPKNLVINLSADKDNYQQALVFHKNFGLRICYLTVDGKVPDDLPDGSVIFPNYTLRGRDLPNPKQAWWWKSLRLREKRMVCPPDFFGQSEALRCGPCDKCLI